MYDRSEHQRSTRLVAPSAARGSFTAFGARHVKGVAISRWLATVCFVVAGAVLLAFGFSLGALFFLPAALNGSLAYLVPRCSLRDASNDADVAA
jgi:hypothetical protein